MRDRGFIGKARKNDAYAVRMGRNAWRVYRLSPAHGIYVEGARLVSYPEACAAVRGEE